MTGESSIARVKYPIFLSYRRSDAGGYAFALFGELERRFGQDVVFYDKYAIDEGSKFTPLIEDTIRGCGAVIALIARDWLTVADKNGKPRLEDPEDLVRREIELALELDKKLIPVLFEVEDQHLPRKEALPGPLQGLAGLDFLHLRGKGEPTSTPVRAALAQSSGRLPDGETA